MKNIKLLLILLVITTITSINGIYAYNVMSLDNISIPALNNNYNTPLTYIPDSQGFQHHYAKNVSVSNTIDIRVWKQVQYGTTTFSPWVNLTNSSSIQLTHDSDDINLWTLGGNFMLQIKSRWYQFSNQTVNHLDWTLE